MALRTRIPIEQKDSILLLTHCYSTIENEPLNVGEIVYIPNFDLMQTTRFEVYWLNLKKNKRVKNILFLTLKQISEEKGRL